MSNYVFGTNLSYKDYLQAQSFEKSILCEISTASRQIIATNAELAREQITVLEQVSSMAGEGFEQLSLDLQAVSLGIKELNSTFTWGFSEVLTHLGALNDSQHELIKIAKAPERNWAYEQFEIARDAFRREHYEDSVQYLNRAISGHGDHTGYPLEYRFHFLLATIRIGSFINDAPEIVDPRQAEHAFLSAAKYALHDCPKEAARSYLGAGWAAYCQGNMQDAERFTKVAVALDDSLAEAHFQLAKVQMHEARPDVALIPLKKAIELDRGYTVKACSDGDFTPYLQAVDSLIETLRQEAKRTFENAIKEVASAIAHLEEYRAERFPPAADALLAPARKVKKEMIQAAGTNTYYGYLSALDLRPSAQHALNDAHRAIARAHQQSQAQIDSRALALRVAASKKASDHADKAIVCAGLSFLCCLPLSIAALCYGFLALREFDKGEGKGKALGTAVTAIILALISALICLMVFTGRFKLGD